MQKILKQISQAVDTKFEDFGGEIPKVIGHLKDVYGNMIQQKIPKIYAFMKVIQIKLPGDEGDRLQLAISYDQMKIQVQGLSDRI